MITILKVDLDQLKITPDVTHGVSGNKNIYEVVIQCSPEWQGFSRSLVVRASDGTGFTITADQNRVSLPSLPKGLISFGLIGVKGNQTISTNWESIVFEEGASPVPTAPPESTWETWLRLLNGKQDKLVSGTNIKTINSQSILGSGNITIQGGVTSVNGKTGTVVLDAEDVGALPEDTAIPTKTSQLTNDSGFGTYTKPTNGIPKTHLATSVKESLGKADTALPMARSYIIAGGTDPTDVIFYSGETRGGLVQYGFYRSIDDGGLYQWQRIDVQDVSGKEDTSNKVTSANFEDNKTDDTKYPTCKAVNDALQLKQNTLTAGTNITIDEDNVISAVVPDDVGSIPYYNDLENVNPSDYDYFTISAATATLTGKKISLTTEGKAIAGIIVIPYKDEDGNPITEIGDFSSASAMSIIIPNSINYISSSAFSGCTNMTNIEIPDSVISLGASAFSGCSSLSSITLSSSLTAIPTGCFNNCSAITKVYYSGDSLAEINSNFNSNSIDFYLVEGTSFETKILDQSHKDIYYIGVKNQKVSKDNPSGTGTFKMNEGVATGTRSTAIGGKVTAIGTDSSANGASDNLATAILTSEEIASVTDVKSPSSQVVDNIITKWNTSKFSLAGGNFSYVSGANCIALARGTRATGNGTVASGKDSVAEGCGSMAKGDYSHAGGLESTASGNSAFAQGYTNTANGEGAVALGKSNTATGTGSISIGEGSKSNANGSVTIGQHLEANTANQVIVGKFNAATSAAFVVGWGNSETGSNKFIVDQGGNGEFAGDVQAIKDGITHKLSEKLNKAHTVITTANELNYARDFGCYQVIMESPEEARGKTPESLRYGELIALPYPQEATQRGTTFRQDYGVQLFFPAGDYNDYKNRFWYRTRNGAGRQGIWNDWVEVNPSSYLTQHQDISGKEDISNKVMSTTGLSGDSTDTQYPSAKCVYDALQNKQNTPSTVTSISGTLQANTIYTLTNVTTLDLSSAFPQTDFECVIRLTTASSGTITITFPQNTKFIGTVPTFSNGEQWEISIVNGVVVAGKAVVQ